jgi:hypothetical protein
MNRIAFAAAVSAVVLLTPAALPAQTDYRNLDAARPLRVADAWPIEQKALEVLGGWRSGRASGSTSHEGVLALTAGLVPNLQVEVALHGTSVGSPAGRRSALEDPEAALLYNLAPERSIFPALAFTAELVGGEPGAGANLSRSFGRQRAHASLAYRRGGRWLHGLALDRTLFRHSLLGAAEVTVRRDGSGAPAALATAAGVRLQVSPYLVLDAGLERQWRRAAGRGVSLTAGLTRSIPAWGFVARGAATSRNEWVYGPGGFNWSFLGRFPEAARLFNAFDYGHAVLYEMLWRHPDSARASAALEREFAFLTGELLVRPPRFAVAEGAIAPEYTRLALRATLVFDWAHVLHRQIYDVYSDPALDDAARRAAVERVTDYYLTNRSLALAAVPKAMELMDEQPYSQVFRRRHAEFNGLIWAYHWLQVGLYEPLLAGRSGEAQQLGIAAALARFREMIATSTGMPRVMPMTPSIAPGFTARHPRAAAIFDNLHMLHDIISDILVSDVVPRLDKAAAIGAALDEFQDAARNVVDREHWLMMADHMGGIEAMGGAVPGVRLERPREHEDHHEEGDRHEQRPRALQSGGPR